MGGLIPHWKKKFTPVISQSWCSICNHHLIKLAAFLPAPFHLGYPKEKSTPVLFLEPWWLFGFQQRLASFVCVWLCYKMSMLLILTTQFLLGTAIQAMREIVFVCVNVKGISTKVTFISHWDLELNLSLLIWDWVQSALKPLRKTFTRRWMESLDYKRCSPVLEEKHVLVATAVSESPPCLPCCLVSNQPWAPVLL